ncbi:hypothetical protein [Burkholderia sp. Bp8992]|uniref:hypothetical protein n=1 Tax=Burkholderia sp. Bp8992 TaxID=2184554 RepID=UPI000F5673C6|nr:hypothetical protein [Burkholderia sp. Bp8992]
MTVFKFTHYDTIQYRNLQAKGRFPPSRPAISSGIAGLVKTAMGNFLANVEAVLADRLKRVSPDDVAHHAQPNLPSTTRSPSP